MLRSLRSLNISLPLIFMILASSTGWSVGPLNDALILPKVANQLESLGIEKTVGSELHLLASITNSKEVGIETRPVISVDENGHPLNLFVLSPDDYVREILPKKTNKKATSSAKAELCSPKRSKSFNLFFFSMEDILQSGICITAFNRKVLTIQAFQSEGSDDIQMVFEYLTNAIFGGTRKNLFTLSGNQFFTEDDLLVQQIHIDFAKFWFIPLGVKRILFNGDALKRKEKVWSKK